MPLELVGDDMPGATPLALADEARRLAGQSNDPEAEDDARITCVTALMNSPDAARMLDDADRSRRLGYRTGGGGWIQTGIALGRLGRLDEMRALTEEMLKAAENSGDRQLPFYALVQQAIEALVRGRFDEAQATTDRALQVAESGEVIYQFNYALLTLARMLNTGQVDDARPLAELLDSNPALDSSHLIGVVAAAQGDLNTTRGVLDAWSSADHKLPVDLMRAGRLWGLAECAHAVGHTDAAQHLYKHVASFDGQLLVYGFAFIPASAAFTLGRLAETLGDHDRALAHYTDALTFEESCGAETFAARTRQALARLD